MKKRDVPQDPGIIEDYGHELCYAVDNNGQYDLVPSIGWEPKNIANHQAWEVIDEEVLKSVKAVKDNLLSPVAYYMAKHQMDVSLLAKYMGFYQWQVKRHLKPKNFNKLSHKVLMSYAALFRVSMDELKSPKDVLSEN